MSVDLPYNPEDANSIFEYAKFLEGKTFREILDSSTGYLSKLGNKGGLGQFLEKNYFKYKPNSAKQSDFFEAGLELKVTPLIKRSKGWVAKERIVLSLINYMTIVNETWENCSLMEKNKLLLLVFYLFEKDKERLDYLMKLVTLWSYPEEDLEIIRQDWNKIVDKIKSGKAHELSEGDTFYLGACTKGVNNTSMRYQLNGPDAKQRAFSLKMSYVNHILNSFRDSDSVITSPSVLRKNSFESIILSKFEKFKGKTFSELSSQFDIDSKAKNKLAMLTSRILGSKKKKVAELEKAGIIVKTLRLKKSGMPKESVSFPYFKFKEVANQSWEDSEFFFQLEKKFLFVIYRMDGSDLIFEKAMFWNMPYKDRQEAKKVWLKTKKLLNGSFKFWKEGNITKNNFPGSSENKVSHVRPHGQNKKDVDELPSGKHFTKQCFWLNQAYLKEVINNT